MSKSLVIYCEGDTERFFVNRVLRPHLVLHGIGKVRAELALTRAQPGGERGGFSNWAAIEQDLRDIFADDPSPKAGFTTLLDVYAIPPQVPGMDRITAPLSLPADIDVVERAMEACFGEPRFKAYLQRHEVEALLLADLRALEKIFQQDKPGIAQLAADTAAHANCEDINHGRQTHPAARLAQAVRGYEYLKADNFHWVLAEADLTLVRQRCPRFDAWLTHWEQWGMNE